MATWIENSRISTSDYSSSAIPTIPLVACAGLTRVGELARSHGVVVVSDEIHGRPGLRGHRHIPFANVSEADHENTVIFTAPSKTFNLAGLATSNIIIPNAEIRAKYVKFVQSLGGARWLALQLHCLQSGYQHGRRGFRSCLSG